MKKCTFLLLLNFYFVSAIFGQSPYSKLYCESDTSFLGKLNISKSGLSFKQVLKSDYNSSSLSGQVVPGKINGICMNKSGNTIPTTGNIGAIQNVIQYVSTEVVSGNLKIGKLYKATATTNREPNLKIYNVSAVTELDQTLFGSNKLNSLGTIKLGVTSYSSSQQKGNYFVNELLSLNNNIQFANVGDSSKVMTLQKISGATYPTDNANYQNILGSLSASENTGWLIEVDRLGDKFDGKRYDLGRGPRIDFFINSTRSSSASNALASVTSSYQIFGDTASIIIKSQLTNGIQKLYVFDETNSLEDYFVLINDVVGGVIQPLRRSQLIDIYSEALKKGGTLFPKLSSIAYSRELEKLLISVQGGKYYSSRFSDTSLIGASNLSKLFTSFDDGFEINVKYGSILYLDLVSNIIENGLSLGNTGIKGKVISNPLQLSVHNFDYQDSLGTIKSLEYLYLTEEVLTNAENQNPSKFSNISEFQNEVYGAILKEDETLDKNKFTLLATLPSNATLKISQYNECYVPFLANLSFKSNATSNSDSVIWMDGFANNFIKGGMCGNVGSVDILNERKLGIFPNPIHKSVNEVVTLNIQKNEEISIFNSKGQLVLKSRDNQLNISNLPTGMYILKAGIAVGKLLIID